MLEHEPDFERLLKAIRFEEPDRVPLQDSVTAGIKSKLLGHPVVGPADEIEFQVKFGYDYVAAAPDVDFELGKDDPNLTRADIHTGQPRKWANQHVGIISSWKDFEQHPWPEASDVSYRLIEEYGRLIPDGMKVWGHRGHIFTEVWKLMGLETFCYAIYDRQDLVDAMFEKIGALVYEMVETMLDMDFVGAIRHNDDLGWSESTLVPPWVYRRWQFPWMRKIVDLCHEKGRPFIFHCDGNVMQVWDDLLELGIDAFHPVEPKAMDIREVREITKGKIALMGNVPQTFPLTFGSPADVRLHVAKLIRDVAPGGGYVLGSGHSVQDYVPPENFIAMVEAALEYGRYPIDIPQAEIRRLEAEAEASPKNYDVDLSGAETATMSSYEEQLIT